MKGYDAVSARLAGEQQDVLTTIEDLRSEVRRIYEADDRPWVIGYSGGKDSTATLRLVYEALCEVPSDKRKKPIFVVSSDTLVETPVVSGLVASTLALVQKAAVEAQLPVQVAQVFPDMTNTFWVNLIGKGYPAPTRQFRWCTERMKIDPVSAFIREKVAKYGEVVVVLGSRSSESATRAQVIKKHRIEGKRLSRHTTLPNAYVYTPIETWNADSVWEYLFSGPAPWGGGHQALFDLYKDSNAGECPLVIDKSTPSCGNSRFGCWTCTVVTEDRAIDGLIQSGQTWMVPLKKFRDELYRSTLPENKQRLRHERRRDGRVTVTIDESGVERHIPGAYRLAVRKEFLRKLLQTQRKIAELNSEQSFELIRLEELEGVRVHWRNDPNEPDWEDSVPQIYREVFGENAVVEWRSYDDALFGGEDARLLDDSCAKQELPGALAMKLLELEISMEGFSKRSQVFAKLSSILSRDWGDVSTARQMRVEESSRMRDRDEQEKRLFLTYETLEKL